MKRMPSAIRNLTLFDPEPYIRSGAVGHLEAGQVSEWRQTKAGRTLLVADKKWGEWGTGARLARSEVGLLQRTLRARDFCLMAMLSQHHYLTTDQIQTLFFPSGHSARHRLHDLLGWGLLFRWNQLEPRTSPERRGGSGIGGFRRQSSVLMLAERGAAILSQWLDSDATAIIRRSLGAVDYSFHIQHHLGANGFFVGLVEASKDLPDQGLYHWLGDDAMRRAFQSEKDVPDLSPDGWGRYLAGGQEIAFHLEWDEGSGAGQRFLDKAKAYVTYYGRERGAHVLWVMPTPRREASIRFQLAKALERPSKASFLTTTWAHLADPGPLGSIWARVGDEANRYCLADLSGRESDYPVEVCLGRPNWWDSRPGGSEGA